MDYGKTGTKMSLLFSHAEGMLITKGASLRSLLGGKLLFSSRRAM
jgi:hypothetical protein